MKVLVIGGGMAGLTYAVIACKNGYDVTVAERNGRVGRKIAMSGNGKCNIGNSKVDLSCYNKSNIVGNVLAEVSVTEYKKYLKSCGIYTFEDNDGRMYPVSESASNTVDCLRAQVEKYGGKIVCEAEVFRVRPAEKGFEALINRVNYYFDKVIMACGSKSQSPETNIFGIVPKEYFTTMCPSLVPVKIRNMDPILNGLRAKVHVSLYDNALTVGNQEGEIQFKDYGLSGICIFNLSALIARKTVQGKNGEYKFAVDLLPAFSLWDLEELLYTRLKNGYELKQLFYGLLHNKIAESIIKRCDGQSDVTKLAYTCKNMTFEFDKLLDYSMSQITAGGIDERYVNCKNLTLPNGIVALGEALNVDGICGGYNLYFAAASALYTFTKEEREIAYDKI